MLRDEHFETSTHVQEHRTLWFNHVTEEGTVSAIRNQVSNLVESRPGPC